MFVDTNVLVYARVLEAPNHEPARELLDRVPGGDEPAQLSRQVLREYLAVMTRPRTWPVSLTREEVIQDVERLAATGLDTRRLPATRCDRVPSGGCRIRVSRPSPVRPHSGPRIDRHILIAERVYLRAVAAHEGTGLPVEVEVGHGHHLP